MAGSIGIRVYLISVGEVNKAKSVSFEHKGIKLHPAKVVSRFIAAHSAVREDSDLERSWYLNEEVSLGTGNSCGYIRYGTYGYESMFVDTQTKNINYHRKTTDTEEIPLYYEFWSPSDCNGIFAVFQSFQGKSCVGIVYRALSKYFEKKNRGFNMRIRKLLPSNESGDLFSSSPIKSLRLIKRNAPSDVAVQYLNIDLPTNIDFEVVLSARRKTNFGRLDNFRKSLQDVGTGTITHDGVSFDEGYAEVQVGRRKRRIGVFGQNSNAGVIDLSDVRRGTDGHPVFEALQAECKEILADFYRRLMRADL